MNQKKKCWKINIQKLQIQVQTLKQKLGVYSEGTYEMIKEDFEYGEFICEQ